MSNWKDKIQKGYLYKIGSDSFTAFTGAGGAIRYGETLEERGLPDNFIQESISITEDDNLYTNTVFTPISQITFKSKS